MKEITLVKRILFLFAFLAAMVSLQTAVAQDTDTPIPEPQALVAPADREVIIVADPTGKTPPPVLAPARTMNPNAVQTATIQVNYINNGDSNWDAQPDAKNAFQYAVDIWETLIYSPVPITIDAYWMPLGPNVLGSAGALDYVYDHPSFPYNRTYYPIALANSITGFDHNLNQADIRARFSSNFSWYFGTDYNTPSNQYNFVTVVLHEIGHGLGFVGSMRWDNGTYNGVTDLIECRGIYNESCWGFTDGGVLRPFIYDRFTKNGSGTPLLNTSVFPNPSVQLRQQLTSNNIIFDGAYAKDKNGGAVPLYAPSLWNQGSTYSHLGENFNFTENALMTYSLAPGETNYHPGPVALGMFKDMGWQVYFPAELAPLPTQLLEVDTEIINAIDLVDYTIRESAFSYSISYNITNYGNPAAGIRFDGRYVSIKPQPGWTGKTTATAQVTDQSNDPHSSTFTVVVAEEIKRVYLPAIIK